MLNFEAVLSRQWLQGLLDQPHQWHQHHSGTFRKGRFSSLWCWSTWAAITKTGCFKKQKCISYSPASEAGIIWGLSSWLLGGRHLVCLYNLFMLGEWCSCLVFLFIKKLNSPSDKAPSSVPHWTLITSQRPQLQIPSYYELGLQILNINLKGDTLSP